MFPMAKDDDQNDETDAGSCFAVRLGRYAPLSQSEIELVARMEKDERAVRKGEALITAGTPVRDLFVVKDGWAATMAPLRDNRRQTLRVFLPGEVVGLSSLGFSTAPHDVTMLTEGKVCPFPRDHMTMVFPRAPRLAALFMAINGVDQISVKDQLAVMGAGDARQRMAHFLIDIHERLLITNPTLGRRFQLPLRQVDMAEVLGLTKVYVNRLLKQFVQEELIEIQRPYIRILQPGTLKDMAGYRNRYAELDLSWFPNRIMPGVV